MFWPTQPTTDGVTETADQNSSFGGPSLKERVGKGSEWRLANRRRQMQKRTTNPRRHANPPPPPCSSPCHPSPSLGSQLRGHPEHQPRPHRRQQRRVLGIPGAYVRAAGRRQVCVGRTPARGSVPSAGGGLRYVCQASRAYSGAGLSVGYETFFVFFPQRTGGSCGNCGRLMAVGAGPAVDGQPTPVSRQSTAIFIRPVPYGGPVHWSLAVLALRTASGSFWNRLTPRHTAEVRCLPFRACFQGRREGGGRHRHRKGIPNPPRQSRRCEWKVVPMGGWHVGAGKTQEATYSN